MWRIPPPQKDIKIGDILICPDQRQVFVGGKDVRLSFREFNFLWALAEAGGRILTYGWIMDNLWDTNVVPATIRVYARYLRRKLGDERKRLITVINVGYRLDQD